MIDVYSAVRDNVTGIINYLRQLKPDRNLFYSIRKSPSIGRVKRSAEFIYLNKTCWNGLYRVNSKGRFNVPYGSPGTDLIADFDNLRECSQALRKPDVRLHTDDFQSALEAVNPGDLVYLDPPYITRHNNNGFVDYNEKLFCWEDQRRLAILARQLAKAGAYVLISNADSQDLHDLYQGFKKHTITRSSTLAADVRYRVRVKEAIFCSHDFGGEV